MCSNDITNSRRSLITSKIDDFGPLDMSIIKVIETAYSYGN